VGACFSGLIRGKPWHVTVVWPDSSRATDANKDTLTFERGETPMPDPAKEQEYREEAEPLAQLAVEDQREIIALHRSVASNPKVPKRERKAGLERADALERLLGLAKKKRRKS